jgi:hypothetical protein
MGDRRFQSRKLNAGKIGLQWKDAADQTVEALADVADMSVSGAKLHTERPVRLQTMVRLAWSGTEISGEVRYCVRRPGGYVVGVEFDSR